MFTKTDESSGQFTLLYFVKVLAGKKVKHNLYQTPGYGCAEVSTTEGVHMLQPLVVHNMKSLCLSLFSSLELH